MAEVEVEVMTRIIEQVSATGLMVYPYLPGEVPYPFLVIESIEGYGDSTLRNKTNDSGRVIVNLQLWLEDVNELGYAIERKNIVKNILKRMRATESFSLKLAPQGVVTGNRNDRSTGKVLRQVTITAEYNFLERRN